MAKKSPFSGVHAQLGANFKEYSGMLLPSDFGDIQAEMDALSTGSGAFDLSGFGRISIKGDGRDHLLNELTGSENLPANGQWSGISLKSSDNLIRIANIDDQYVVLTMPADKEQVLIQLQDLSGNISDKVKIIDSTEKTAMLGVYGPKSFSAIDSILPIDIGGMSYGCVISHSVIMFKIFGLRGSWLDCDGLELICPASAAGYAAGAIMKYRERQGIIPCGMDVLLEAMKQSG